MLRELLLGLPFRDDREDFNVLLSDVIEHPRFAYAEAVLRLRDPTQTLDAAPTFVRGSVSQVLLDGVLHQRPQVGPQTTQIFDSFRRQDDLVRHSG